MELKGRYFLVFFLWNSHIFEVMPQYVLKKSSNKDRVYDTVKSLEAIQNTLKFCHAVAILFQHPNSQMQRGRDAAQYSDFWFLPLC